MRLFLITSPRVPAPPYAGAEPPTAEQALLLLSLSCLAGVEPSQLALLRIDDLFGADGAPRDHVRIRGETTKHRMARRLPMHPDVRRDALAFRERHPEQDWVAFIGERGASAAKRTMSPHGLGQWLRQAFQNAALDGLSDHQRERRPAAAAAGARP